MCAAITAVCVVVEVVCVQHTFITPHRLLLQQHTAVTAAHIHHTTQTSTTHTAVTAAHIHHTTQTNSTTTHTAVTVEVVCVV